MKRERATVHETYPIVGQNRSERKCFIEPIQAVVELDPQWADPHSALGQRYFLYGAFGLRLSETIPLARAEALRALELLPSEPLAHAVLGAIAAVHDYDWPEADEQFKLARASESVSPSVHHMYAGFYLSPLGRFDEALELSERMIAEEPAEHGVSRASAIYTPFSQKCMNARNAATELVVAKAVRTGRTHCSQRSSTEEGDEEKIVEMPSL